MKVILKYKVILKIFLISFLLIGNVFAQETKELFSLTLEELMNVKVVTASKFSEKVSDVPASVVIITRDDIESHGYRNILEVLENIPGVYLHRSY
jgi:outer membrane receptor for ferrienterochelin and colicin